MFASTQVLTASAESPACASPFVLSSKKRQTNSAGDGITVVSPADPEVRSTEQLPVVPTVVHVGELNEPGPLNFVKLINVSAGAFTKPEPSLDRKSVV